MKKTKSVVRFLACLVLVMIFTFALASCDKIEQIFNKHEHTYTHVVTPPTCEGQGYTTHTCECGDSYVDGYVPVSHELVIHEAKDPTCTEVGYAEYFTCRKCSYTTYQEIAAVGHAYEEKVTRFPTTMHSGILSNICSECGDTQDEEIKAATVNLPRVAELIKSFVGMNEISIDADNTEIIFIDEIDGEDGVSKRFIAVDLTRFELSGKEEELYAHITLELGIATLDASDENTEPVFSTQMLVDVLANGDDVSVSVTEGDDLENGDINLTEEFYGYIAEYLGMTYEELAETYYLVEKLVEYLPVLEGVLEWISKIELPDGSTGLNAFASVVGEIVSTDEDGYYYLDIFGLIGLIESNKDLPVASVVDKYLGKGTMTTVEAFLLTLPMTKVKTLAKSAEAVAETYEIPVDDVYSLINYLVYTVTGEDFNIEHEIKVRYNKTVAEVIIELTNQGNQNITEEDINVMALAMVNEIKSVLNVLKTHSIDRVYNLYTYDDADFDYSYTEQIISTLENIDASFDARWHYSESGELDALDVCVTGVLSIDYDLVGGDVTASLEIVYSEGKTLGLSASITETNTSLVLISDGYEILTLSAVYEGDVLVSSELKLNALYVGALEGYTETQNLINVITATYLKGDGEKFESSFILNTVSSKEGTTPEETVNAVETAIDMTTEFDGVDTLVTVANGKVITLIGSESEEGSEIHLTVKEGETVLADITANGVAVLGEGGFVSEAHITANGDVEGHKLDVAVDYVDGTLSALCKLDEVEVADVVISIDENGNIDVDCILEGVNVTTEILSYIKEVVGIIGNLDVLEQLPAVA